MKNTGPHQKLSLSFCFIGKLYLFLLAFVSLLLCHALTYGTELKQEKRVLILFPAQSDLPAYPLVEKGIKSSLKAGTEFHILTRECEGKSFPPWEAAPIVAKAADAPVCACLDSYFDSGIVGRRLTRNSFNRAY